MAKTNFFPLRIKPFSINGEALTGFSKAPADYKPALTTVKLRAQELLNTAVTENGSALYLCASVATDGQAPCRMVCVSSRGFSLASPKIISTGEVREERQQILT